MEIKVRLKNVRKKRKAVCKSKIKISGISRKISYCIMNMDTEDSEVPNSPFIVKIRKS